MKHATQRIVMSLLLLSAPMLVLAQGAPARETPRPQDVDPGVNTSAPSQAPARDSRPQDIDPAVNTSAAAPANEDAGASSSTPAGAAGSGASASTLGAYFFAAFCPWRVQIAMTPHALSRPPNCGGTVAPPG